MPTDKNGIEYPREHNGVIVYGPEDFPGGKPPAVLVRAYGGEPSNAEPEANDEGDEAVNLNTADAKALQTIKHVGKKTAEDIVSEREADGPFESLEDAAERVGGVSLEALQAAGATV